MESLWTPEDLCELLQISRRTLHRWIGSGRVPPPIRIGSEERPMLRWPPDVIRKWLADGCPPGAAGEETDS